MKLKQVDKVQFCQNLSSSLLTPERISEMYRSYSGVPGDSDQVIDDDKLLEVYEEIFSKDTKIKQVIRLLKYSDEYSRLTKGFVNVDATYENLSHFLVKDTGNDRYRNNINVRVATSLLRDMMKIETLQPLLVKRGHPVDHLISNGDAVCGTICSGKKKDHERILTAYATSIKNQISKGTHVSEVWIPAKGGHRAQLGNLVNEDGTKLAPFEDIKQKDRYVWAIDGGTGLVEAQYSMPLTQHLSKVDFFSPGKEPPHQRDLIRRAHLEQRYWTSIDYSKFDQTIPAWLISLCFDIVKMFYDKQFHREIGWIAYNFINTHVIVPGGQVYQKDHGIPSGSGFTQVIGTMCNMIIMLTYVAHLCDGSFEEKEKFVRTQLAVGIPSEHHYSIFAQGDDNLIFTQKKLDMNDLSCYSHHLFGVNINPEKCDQGSRANFPVYLKRSWRPFGEWQNPVYLVANTTHPESYRKYDNYSPWHIIYCLWLTYKYAFPTDLVEEHIIEQMHKNGGIDLLLRIPRNALPGVAKAFPRSYLEKVHERAERVYQSVKTDYRSA